MRLYFLRHGIAQERSIDLPDAQRQLVEAGIKNTEKLASRLEKFGVNPTIIYTSPLARAYQTAHIVSTQLNVPLQSADGLAAGFDARAAQALVDQHDEKDDIMLVGHEPTFSETISYIIGGGNIKMKKGGLARIDLFSKHPLHGELVWLIAPKTL